MSCSVPGCVRPVRHPGFHTTVEAVAAREDAARPARRPSAKLSEARWQSQVVQMAHTFGWMVAHFRPALNQRGKWQTAVGADGAGFPDLVLVHVATSDLLFVELKTDTGVLSPAQQKWLLVLEPDHLAEEDRRRARVWRPRDFAQVRARLMVHHQGPRRGDDNPAHETSPA